jgi:hypothetical protein
MFLYTERRDVADVLPIIDALRAMRRRFLW